MCKFVLLNYVHRLIMRVVRWIGSSGLENDEQIRLEERRTGWNSYSYVIFYFSVSVSVTVVVFSVTVIVLQFLFLFQLVILHKICISA